MDKRVEGISSGVPINLLVNEHHDDSDMSWDGIRLAQSLVGS